MIMVMISIVVFIIICEEKVIVSMDNVEWI